MSGRCCASTARHPSAPPSTSGLARALGAVCLDADALLDTVDRTCLVHSDFNGKNILVDPAAGFVTALLDWEYAHAGSPYADLGNLLRFERGTAWAAEMLTAFIDRTPVIGSDPLTLAYARDLWALIDLAGRRSTNPVTEAATRLLDAIARTGDPHPVPAD